MKTIVIYKSRTGFTKRYAEWISEELSCKAISLKEIMNNSLNEKVDRIIYGGRVHAGIIDGLKKIKELAANNKCELIVFATGATPLEATEEINRVWETNFKDSSIPHFYMQSGLCYEKMGTADRLLMKMVSKMMKK